jgi:hypothetical protein
MFGNYALSWRAYLRLLEQGFTNKLICQEAGALDHEIAICLEHLDVIKIDGIDAKGQHSFFVDNPEPALFPEKTENFDEWYWQKVKQGIGQCCSDQLVSVQNVYESHIYYWEYFTYKVQAFGRDRKTEQLPRKLSLSEVIQGKI